MKEKNRLLSMGIDPDTKTLSENLGVSEKAVLVMDQRLGEQGGEVSIDKPLFQDSEKGTLGDSLVDPNYEGGLENIVAPSHEVAPSQKKPRWLHGDPQATRPRYL